MIHHKSLENQRVEDMIMILEEEIIEYKYIHNSNNMYKNNQTINLFQKNTEEVMMVFNDYYFLDKWCHWDIKKNQKTIKTKQKLK